MQGEVHEIKRARRANSLQRMATWLEAQGRANAEEGSPRTDDDGEERENVPLILLAVRSPPEVAPVEAEENVVWPEERGQQPSTSSFAVRKGSVCRAV